MQCVWPAPNAKSQWSLALEERALNEDSIFIVKHITLVATSALMFALLACPFLQGQILKASELCVKSERAREAREERETERERKQEQKR